MSATSKPGLTLGGLFDAAESTRRAAGAKSRHWVRKLEVLEKFNGQTFVNPILFQTAIQEAHWEKLIDNNGNTESALSSVAYINAPLSVRAEVRE